MYASGKIRLTYASLYISRRPTEDYLLCLLAVGECPLPPPAYTTRVNGMCSKSFRDSVVCRKKPLSVHPGLPHKTSWGLHYMGWSGRSLGLPYKHKQGQSITWKVEGKVFCPPNFDPRIDLFSDPNKIRTFIHALFKK